MTVPTSDHDGCALGHTSKAMECPSCSYSTDPAWWKWYKSRTSSADVRAKVVAWLAEHSGEVQR